MAKGGGGIKVMCKGRLGGNEIARSEGYRVGKVPLGTFRANIDYGFAEAFTTYGTIGVKVWIYLGDVLVKKKEAELMREREKHAALEAEKAKGKAHGDPGAEKVSAEAAASTPVPEPSAPSAPQDQGQSS